MSTNWLRQAKEENMDDTQDTNLSRYIIIFIASYIGIMIALAVVGYLTAATSLSGVKLITPMLCGTIVNDSFLRRNKRLYTPSEKKKLIRGGLLGVLVIELIFSVSMIYSGILSDIALPKQTLLFISLGVLLFMLVLNYGLLLWVYGKMAEARLKKIEKKHGSISDVFD